MTSLAKQLERLAVPFTQSLLTQDNRRCSLLFDPKEAANLDKDTLFSLGLSGLEELESIDSSYEEYEASLFNKNSQNWDRSVQTRSVNDKLDKTIQRFLIQISPFLLIKCSHKTLEWLIYRYRIQEYNVDDLMMCIMPYHETKIFVRCIQLLKLADPTSKWHWLEACAKSGTPLARGTLINHCRKDVGFLGFICEIVQKYINVHGEDSKQLRAVVSFFAGASLGAVHHKEDVGEKILSVLIPHLVQAFKSRCMDYKAACYMVLCQITVQTQLKEKLLESLLVVLTRRIPPSLTQEALGCIAVVFQTQQFCQLPKKSFKHLCKQPGVVHLLANLSKKYDMGPLLGAWLDRLIPQAIRRGDFSGASTSEGSEDFGQGRPMYGSLLDSSLAEFDLKADNVHKIASSIIDGLIDKRRSLGLFDEDAILSWQSQTKSYMCTLERRFSKIMEKVVDESLIRHQKDSDQLEVLREVMSLSSQPMKFEILPDASTNLFLGLNHSRSSVRLMAVKHLIQCVEKSTIADPKFVEEMLIQRLMDDNSEIVLSIILLKEKLIEVVDGKKLCDALYRLIRRDSGTNYWTKVRGLALELVSSEALTEANPNWRLSILPYLFLTQDSESHRDTVGKILASKRAKSDPLLKTISTSWSILKDSSDDESDNRSCKLNACLIDCLANGLASGSSTNNTFITGMLASCDGHSAYTFLVILVLSKLIENLSQQKSAASHTRCIRLCSQLLRVLKPQVLSCKRKKVKKAAGDSFLERLSVWIRLFTEKSAVPFGALVWSCETMAECLKFLKFTGDWVDSSEPSCQMLLMLMDMLMKVSCDDHSRSKTWRPLLNRIVNELLNCDVVHKIMAYLWLADLRRESGDQDTVSPLLQVGSFYLLNSYWESSMSSGSVSFPDIISTDCPVFPSLLCCLLSGQEVVRRGALACLVFLKGKLKKTETVHYTLMKKIVSHQEEILADPQHTLQTFGRVFSDVETLSAKDKSGKPEARRQSLDQLTVWATGGATPVGVKYRLLTLLQLVPHQLILETITPLGESIIAGCDTASPALSRVDIDILKTILDHFEPDMAPSLIKEGKAYLFIKKALETSKSPVDGVTPQTMTLKMMTKGFYQALPTLRMQQDLLAHLLSAAINTQESRVQSLFMSCLKQLKLTGIQIEGEIKGEEGEEATTVRGKKRMRTRKAVTKLDLQRLCLLLEVLLNRKKIKYQDCLLNALFDLLKRLQAETDEDVDYCRQLALTCLHNLCSKLTPENNVTAEENFNVEVLVNCIRMTSSTQTQQQALLVMACLAPLCPEYILHNVMAIFTFMGNNLLQQDDSYSFQVISRTIETIIPAIIKAHQEKGSDHHKVEKTITDILRVFVDARNHIPRHRSQLVFRQLLETVGISKYLWIMICLCMENMVRNKDIPDMAENLAAEVPREELSKVDKDIESTVALSSLFGAHDQLLAITKVMGVLLQMTDCQATPDQKTRSRKSADTRVPVITMSTLTPQQCRLLQYHTTRLMTVMLSREQFISEVLSQSTEISMNDRLGSKFQELVQECLCYLVKVSRVSGSTGANPVGRFWRALLHKVYEVLDKVNYLLPSEVFIEVSASLMQHEMISIRRKALELFNNKLQHMDIGRLTDSQVGSLVDVVDKLIELAKPAPHSPESDTDIVNSRQMAFFSLKLLCKLLGSSWPKRFVQMFEVSIEAVTQTDQSPLLVGSSLLCIAELCSSLKAHAIPHLSSFMPPVIKMLKDKSLLKSHELVLTCCLTVLQRVLSSLHHFLSPYLNDIVLVVCDLSCMVDLDDVSTKKSQPVIRLNLVRHLLATLIGPRVLLPSLSAAHNSLLESEPAGLSCLMFVLKEHVESMSKEDLLAHNSTLLTLYCSALDIRNTQVELSSQDVDKIEGEAVEALIAMVVRASENTFRPMFYKLYDWACREDDQIHRNRHITFYRLCDQLSARLRSLFNLFVTHIIKQTCQLLDQNNSMKGDVTHYGTDEAASQKTCALLSYILGCLHKCFLHDTDGFVNKDIFNMLLNPIVDQIENVFGGDESYKTRVTAHLVPCISQLAVASRDDASWKSLNYQVLLKTRHSSAKVRYAALNVAHDIANKLGDEYMTLIPETIPFLAELMEDDSEEVEQECQRVTAALEELLGESLQKYF